MTKAEPKVTPEVVAFRKAELMLMMFGPKDLVDWQKVALHDHYGTWDMDRCWITAKKKFKEAEDKARVRPCRECYEDYDHDINFQKGISPEYCTEDCSRRQSVRVAIAYPEETKGWLWTDANA